MVWSRLPFGVRNGPPAFQRGMTQAIREHGLEEIVACFIDDLATGGGTHEEAVQNAEKLFTMLEDFHLLAGADKVFMGLSEMKFLGYLLVAGQLQPDPDKVAAVERLLPPCTRSEARAFLGLTGYYRDFIRDYAKRARPINLLLHEDVQWEWTPTCQ